MANARALAGRVPDEMIQKSLIVLDFLVPGRCRLPSVLFSLEFSQGVLQNGLDEFIHDAHMRCSLAAH